MTQTRLHLLAAKDRAQKLFAMFELEFEEDGTPLALIEADEAAGICELSVYSADPDRDVARMCEVAGETLEIQREKLPDIDWVAKSLEGLKPVRAGRFLVHGSHDRDAIQESDIAIEIDAGQAFGTGHHGTTAGCLEMIGWIVSQEHPECALDLGTGSAVLAIAIARLAGIPVLATDIDPVAVEVARQNVRLNGVEKLVDTFAADGLAHPKLAGQRFPLIVANILAGPLVQLAPEMARCLDPEGSLVLSGILVQQRSKVLAAYRAEGFRHIRTLRIGEWVTLHLKR